MFNTYSVDVKHLLQDGENLLSVRLRSPLTYARESFKNRPLYGVEGTVPGYQHIRKAHFMFGWDWGPQLPDMGIWRDVELVGESLCEISGAYYTQQFNDDFSSVKLTIKPEIGLYGVRPLELLAELDLSDGRGFFKRAPVHECTEIAFEIDNPPLWQVRGYGKQLLNKICLTIFDQNERVCVHEEQIGLRKLTVNHDGKFCFTCNGVEIFAMGANVIPSDQILPFITEQREKELLNQCVDANFNTVRVWGGGFYPSDFFLSECDRLGLILWQDFMFACAAYRLTPQLEASIKTELDCNIRRIRNHACLGLWCGNNEIESMWEGWGVPDDPQCRSDYVKLFEDIIPETLKKLDPERFYWPSSPSSGGSQYGGECFKGSSDNHRGDQHYWAVWHSFKPLEDFRRELYPFCSEFGFESIPSIKTIKAFAREQDLNLCSPVMEAHQKCILGNEKLLFYVAQLCRTPISFEKLIYATQLVQAESIRSNVEHMRRHRGVCMGSLYWQINDSNPVISWASVDYFGRLKGLHYAARRFYSPLLISVFEENHAAVELHFSNETMYERNGIFRWALRRNNGEVVRCEEHEFTSKPLSSKVLDTLDFSKELAGFAKREMFLEYFALENDTIVSRGCTIFVRPKSFSFLPPEVKLEIEETPSAFSLRFTTGVFVKCIMLEIADCDCVFSDNFFDLCGERTIEIDKDTLSRPLSATELRRKITAISCFDLQ